VSIDVSIERRMRDAFGRLRTASPISQFDYQNQYNSGALLWSTTIGGTGAITHQPNTSTVLLSTGGTASGAKVYRQTKQYMRYSPGKSLMGLMTFCLGAAKANVRKRVGYFDARNGIFLQESGGAISLVLRSYGTGSVVDTVVNQADWNGDQLNGERVSKTIADFTKSQILIIDIQWLGVGSVRCALEIDGAIHVMHEFKNANAIDSTYMTTANLPIRYEIENIGTAASTSTMLQICSTVITEQGSVDDGGYYTHTANTGATPKSVTTRQAILTIRPKLLLNSIVNRAKIAVMDIDLMIGGNDVMWELVYNGTIGGSPSYTDIGANSAVEYDIAGTTVTGGEIIHSGFTPAGSGQTRITSSEVVTSQFPIALDIDGANPATMTLVCTSVTGTATALCSISFREYY
jgi:hypothetical protein